MHYEARTRFQIDNGLVCVGAQKAATTWLFHLLSKHSQLYSPLCKELSYFSFVHDGCPYIGEALGQRLISACSGSPQSVKRYFAQEPAEPHEEELYRFLDACRSPVNDEWYYRVLQTSRQWSVDVSPEYAVLGWPGLAHMRRMFKNLRILFVLREPARRAISGVIQAERHDVDRLSSFSQSDWEKALMNPRQREHGEYVKNYTRFSKVFGPGQIIVEFYEDMVRDPKSFLGRILKRLGLEVEDEQEKLLHTKIYQSPKVSVPEGVRPFLIDSFRPMVEELNSTIKQVPPEWQQIYLA